MSRSYDDLCTCVVSQTNALGAILIVLHGEQGSGISVRMRGPENARQLMPIVPDLLRDVAKQIQQQRESSCGIQRINR